MKIQCDACNKHPASFFCTADEAALCDGCDHRVHRANKLASKHHRFSLNHPSSKHHFPLCDVCLEKRAFIFCQQDRAILCKECDFSIHSANELTKKHSRFLLTGIKLSASPTLYSPSSSSLSNSNLSVDSSLNSSLPSKNNSPSSIASVPHPTVTNDEQGEVGFASSMSEYLINTIPGWKFEDFLDSPSAVPFANYSKKNGDGSLKSVVDGDIERNLVSSWLESMEGMWVPQAPSSLYSEEIMLDGSSRSRLGDDSFIVPQMSYPSNINSSKRSTHLWYHCWDHTHF